jgi:hypothetical protein
MRAMFMLSLVAWMDYMAVRQQLLPLCSLVKMGSHSTCALVLVMDFY